VVFKMVASFSPKSKFKYTQRILLQAISREISGTQSGVSGRCSCLPDLGNADRTIEKPAACSLQCRTGVLRIQVTYIYVPKYNIALFYSVEYYYLYGVQDN
jgi:hypothetical protein